MIAIGTSAPELVTTLTSTLRGDRAPADVRIPRDVIAADLLVLAAVAVITVPVLVSGPSSTRRSMTAACSSQPRVSRLEGGAFVAAYLGYLVWLSVV